MTRNPPLNALCAVGRRSPIVTDGFHSCFNARLHWIIFVELGMKVDGKYTWTTTVASCRRSRCCQSCVALLATRLCSGKPPRSWNSPASSANTTFYICSSVAAKQSGPKTSWIPNLGTDAENCRNVCIEYTASRHQRLEAAPHWHMGK